MSSLLELTQLKCPLGQPCDKRITPLIEGGLPLCLVALDVSGDPLQCSPRPSGALSPHGETGPSAFNLLA